MARISSTVGLVSGINSADIIDQLMSLESAGKTRLQTRVDSLNSQKLAYTDLRTRLTTLKISGTTLKKTSTFQNAAATSSNEDVLTATASAGAATGSFSLQVSRLVSTQQTVSRGFSDFNSAKVGAGALTFSLGGGELSTQNELSSLNGGSGVRRGQFRITDRSGSTTVIDTTDAVTIQDVVKKINTALDVQVKATLSGDRITLTDISGASTSNLIVQDIGEGAAAADLGIVGNAAANTIAGTDINYLGLNTALSQINDGRGVRKASTGNDIAVTARDGSVTNINLATAKTIGDVITAVNTAGGAKFKAELTPGGNGITLTDTSGGGGTLSVANIGDSKAAEDLGLTAAASGNTLSGASLLAGMGSVMLKSLNGGAGLTLGSIAITSRSGGNTTVNLSAAQSFQDVIDTINNANAGVKASINTAGNGLQLVDTTGVTGDLVIASSGGTTAEDLGIDGTFGTTTTTIKGSNLHRAYITQNTLLTAYGGGKGVAQGKFSITNSAGASYNVNITSSQITLGDVIKQINSSVNGVTASINANGTGLLLTDTAGGAAKLKVEDIDATTATDLNIKTTATTTTIDGSMEKTITVDANDTLSTLQTKINELNFGVTASIINDGTGGTPYRLSLTAKNSGRAGRVSIDAGDTTLDTRNLVEAQDSAVFLGGAASDQPLLITSSKNQIAGAIKGVNISLNGVSKEPVTLNISRTSENIVEQLTSFSTTFNELVDKMGELTKFDTETNERGLLLGDSTIQTVETTIYSIFSRVIKDNGKYRTFGDVGLKLVDGARIEFDEEKFNTAYADNPDAVSRLFTLTETLTDDKGKETINYIGLAGLFEKAMDRLIDPVDGAISRQNKEIDSRSLQFQDRIEQMDKLLEAKRARLERQFASMETALSKLQAQQTSLGQIKNITSSS